MYRNADEWLSSLREPIVVIGNGPMAPLVETAHGSVIRFNNFELNEVAGFRVTHWVTSGYKDIEARPLPCALVPWSEGSAAAKHCRAFVQRTKRRLLFTAHNAHILRWFPQAEQSFRFFPSTGFCLLALLWYHQLFPRVAGFNGLKDGHYWNPAHAHAHQLTAPREIAIIRQQITSHPYEQPRKSNRTKKAVAGVA